MKGSCVTDTGPTVPNDGFSRSTRVRLRRLEGKSSGAFTIERRPAIGSKHVLAIAAVLILGTGLACSVGRSTSPQPTLIDLTSPPGVTRADAGNWRHIRIPHGDCSFAVPTSTQVSLSKDGGKALVAPRRGSIRAVLHGSSPSAMVVAIDELMTSFPSPGPDRLAAHLTLFAAAYDRELALFGYLYPTPEVLGMRAVAVGPLRGYEYALRGECVSKRYVELFQGKRRYAFVVAGRGPELPAPLLSDFYAMVASFRHQATTS